MAFEDAIIKLAEEKEGCEIIHREKFFSKQIGDVTLSAHIDGQFASGFNAHPVLFEGKTSNHWAFTSTKKEITDALDENGQLTSSFQIIQKWGLEGTDQTAQEYQIQAAVQRICTGAELVKLSVLVFPRAQQDYEDMGWKVEHRPDGIVKYYLKNDNCNVSKDGSVFIMQWARGWAQQGNFHTYNLPSNPELERVIIEAVQRFHTENFLPGIPPAPTDFADVRRLLPNPLGTVIATPELITLCREYSENTRQLGAASPIRARQEILKTQISDQANQLRRSDPTNPPDKFLILDPNGGDTLATVGKDKNGLISFRAARAR